MRLLSLTLSNFKGIKDFTLEADGKPVNVFGANATGKTTLSDALHWLLFDKDSAGRKDFEIKTLDATGEALHNLEHAVEAVLDVDGGTAVTLRKVYREQWTKKRGSAKASFTGHTTDYFVDGVPVPLKDYKARIAEIADEETFRLLTNPGHFHAMHWQDRRRILLEVCGDISDADVIASNKKLKRLPEILGTRSLDDQRKVLAARRREINDEIERIPVRIAEVERGLPEAPAKVTGPTAADLDAKIAKTREDIACIDAGGEAAEQTKRKREIEAELLALDNEAQAAVNAGRADADAGLSAMRAKVSAARDRLAELEAERERKQRAVAENTDTVTLKQARMKALRDAWTERNAQGFSYEHKDETCPTCGQQLPLEQLEAAVKKAEADFNRDKAEKLEATGAEGKSLKTQTDDLAGKSEALRHEIETLTESITAQGEVVADLIEEVDHVGGDVLPSFEQKESTNAGRTAKLEELTQVEILIESLKADAAPKRAELTAEIERLQIERRALDDAARDIMVIDKGRARIDELAAEEKNLATEFERLEADLFLTEEFVRAKVALLEDRINGRFELARFRLFETQINGGLAECCETLVGGVPYSSGLNNAARIAVGLDVIKTLSAHYGVTAPVFLDNAEAITDIPAIDAQLIALYVSENDPSLRVERV